MRSYLTYLSFCWLIMLLLMTGCIQISEASLEQVEQKNQTYDSPDVVIATLTPLATWQAGLLEAELASAFSSGAESKPLTELVAATATLEASATPSASPTLLASLTVPPSPAPQEPPTAEISPTPSPDLEAELSVTMQSGDSVWEVALEHGLELNSLLAYNGIKEPTEVYVGTTLRIPQGSARIAAMYAVATAVSQVTFIPTAIPPTSTPIPTATPIPPTPTHTPIAQRVVWETSHTYQKLNNCAPASTSILLSYYGINATQFDMAALQKPVSGDVNVTPEEVAESIRLLELGAYVGYNGSTNLLIRLLANGFLVMTEEWMAYDGGVGHFRVVRGYDLSEKKLLYNDTFYGPNLWRSYDAFELAWEPFNNKFIVAYTKDQEAKLRSIIGVNWNEAAMYETLRAMSATQLKSEPTNAYAWWGLGEALLRQGRAPEAIDAFEEALATNKLPWRYLWYRYGYFDALNRVERYDDLLEVTQAPLSQMGRSEDIRYHRAVAFYAQGNSEQAKAELRLALNDNPRFKPATLFLQQLEREG
jgi:tetratricopeptide (TPR) repeat protein